MKELHDIISIPSQPTFDHPHYAFCYSLPQIVLLLVLYLCQRTYYAASFVMPIPYPCPETFSTSSAIVTSTSASHLICSNIFSLFLPLTSSPLTIHMLRFCSSLKANQATYLTILSCYFLEIFTIKLLHWIFSTGSLASSLSNCSSTLYNLASQGCSPKTTLS